MTDLPDPPTFKSALIRLGIAIVLLTILVVGTINYSTYTPPAQAQVTDKKQASDAATKVSKQRAGKKTSTSSSAVSGNGSQKHAGKTPARSVSTGAASGAAGTSSSVSYSADNATPTVPVLTDFEQLSGSRFSELPLNPLAVPSVESITLPVTDESYAIWGSLGTDDHGRIWTAISSDGREASSAQLVSYQLPDAKSLWEGTDGAVTRGRVLDELQKNGLYKEGMGQAKIHSRIVQGADGYLYFSSQDEFGEQADGSVNPTWGGWLWRMRAPDFKWEPLFHAPQGLIAVAGYGTDIYALGYHNHVLYHFDTNTGKHSHVEVGSIKGHISRNFLVDRMGNVFVPRVTRGLIDSDPLVVELVQYDSQLRKIAATKIDHYLTKNPADSHGIISFVNMKDGSIIFATHMGYLYRIAAPLREGRASAVTAIGYFHPEGSRYTPTMHTYSGTRYLLGVTKAMNPTSGKPAFEWIVYDLYLNESKASPLDILPPEGQSARNLLLYGSMTRDVEGNFYIVGTHLNARTPMLLKLTPKMD